MSEWISSARSRSQLRADPLFRPLQRSIPILFSLLALTIVAGCKSGEDKHAATGTQILRVSQRNEPSGLDPAVATLADDFGILRAFFEGLLIPGPAGEPAPGAAERYDVSTDGLRYTFHLRPNARWSNGETITAAHFVAAYQRLLSPATAAPKARVFYPVRNARAFATGTRDDFSAVGFQATGPHTLVVTLEQPTPRFPYYVMSGPWLPVHIPTVERHGRRWATPENFVGNGPFALQEWRADQRIVAKRNPHWHGAAHVKLEEIHFMRFDNGETEERAFRTGQIHATMAVPFSKLEVIARERPGELRRAPMIETRYLTFNTRHRPLDDARVRRALSYALDRAIIVDRVLKGGQSTAQRFVPPALQAASGGGIPGAAEHRHAPVLARELMASAGITPQTFPRFAVACWSPSQVPVLEAAQAMWKQELGLDVAIVLREAKVHLASLASGDYDIAFITAIPDVADVADLLGDFVSGSPENYPQWKDSAFDTAFAHARSLGGAAESAKAFNAAEQLLLEAAVVAPLYFNSKIWLMSPRVQGWQEDGLWSRCYQNVFLEER